MIPNVYVHLVNELPLLVDVFELPAPADISVRSGSALAAVVEPVDLADVLGRLSYAGGEA
ncbi:MAG: hypothetical protein ABI797_07860 [Chloroflexota bacterium]